MKKKFIWRSIALTLVFALLIQVMPVSALSINNTVNKSSGNEAESTIVEENVNVFSYTDVLEANDENIICEVPELREETVKHFRLTDGSMVAAVYDLPVHEQASDGTWVDIDNTIASGEDDEGSSALTKGNAISFANKAKDGKLLTIKTDYGKIKWSLDGISGKVKAAAYVAPEVETNNTKMAVKSASGIITYEDVMTDVDLNYQLVGNDIKENIILNSSAAAQSFSFTLDIGNKMIAVLENNCVVIYSSTGKVVRTISAPYMMDANDIISDNVTLSLTENKKNYTVTVTPDMEWLLDESRAYPVIIDPTITKTYTNSTVDNTSVNSNRPTSSAMYQYGVLYVGRESSSYGNLRGVFKFTLPTGITESDMIIDAYVKLTQRNYYGSGSVTVNAHQITSSLALSSLTWNKLNGKYSSTVLDSQVASSSTKESHFIWDITAAVKSWYLNGNNYGLALVSENEGSTYKYATFYTSRYPDITTAKLPAATITYLNHDGLEDYLTYHEAGSSTMGSIAVGDFNGNLIYAYTDLSMTGNYMPVTIQHVYNHSQRANETLPGASMHYGAGMRLNISQRIQTSSISGYPYKYTDADGTVHYFTLKSGTSGEAGSVYEKEFDTTTTLTIESDGTYTLSDGGTTTYKFNTYGFLKKIIDESNDKSISIVYSSGLLRTVTDGAGRVTTFTFNDDNYLSSMTDPSGRTTTYTYENNCLTQITKPDGTTVKLTYTYTNSTYMLTGIEDIDGSKITVSYYTYAPHRVASLTEYGTEGTEGNKLTWTYTAGETTVTDRDGKSETMMFDNSGHTVCIRDGEGNAVYGSYSNTEDNNKNSLLYQSNMQSTITNYLQNHTLEASAISPWATYNSSGTGTLALDTTTANTASKSAKITSTVATGVVGAYQETTISGAAGETVTLSAYMKADGITKGTAENAGVRFGIAYQTTADVWTTVFSEPMSVASVWTRYSHSFTLPDTLTSEAVRAFIVLDNASGTVNFDNVQLEKGAVANRYNFVENGNFREATGATSAQGWTNWNLSTSTDKTVAGHDGTGFKITGAVSTFKNINQDTGLSGSEGDSFIISGWGKSTMMPRINKMTGIARNFALRVRFTATDGTTQENYYFHFEAKTTNWQYVSGTVTAPFDYSNVQVACLYNKQKNSAVFDDIQLYRESFGVSYTYDNNGRVLTEKNVLGQITSYTYANDTSDDISRIDYYDGTFETYTYDSEMRVIEYCDIDGNITKYEYDEDGNLIEASQEADGETITSSEVSYSDNYINSETDNLGNTVYYSYDENSGVLLYATDASGVTTRYTYNQYTDDLLTVTTGSSTNNYTYENGQVKTISHNTTGTANDVVYTFQYDEFGNDIATFVGNQVLATNTYAEYNGNLIRTTYGNGDYIEPVYDSLDRVSAMKYNGVEKYNWVYGADGNVGVHNDLVNDVSWRYEYNLNGDGTRVIGDNGTEFSYTYDDSTGNLAAARTTVDDVTKTTTYLYSPTSTLMGVAYSDGDSVVYSYDGFMRTTGVTVENGTDTVFSTSYSYLAALEENETTDVISTLTNQGNGWSSALGYTYDSRGNIETISENGTQKAKYYYDDLNQLVREDNAWLGKTIAYTYDNGGNIQLVEEYAYTSGALDGLTATNSYTYLYGDSNWKDKLTSYNGNTIPYDEIGNPLTYNGYTYTWQNGRELAGVSGNGLTTSYKYNAYGIRTQKTVNGVTTYYTIEGFDIVHETNGTDSIWYNYDASGALVSMTLNGTTYYYVANLQGDIVALTDSEGNIVVEYLYDSWGKLISTTGSLSNTVGIKNPYRYRSYRYDTETGWYYLQSRYYDPEMKRFINADIYVDTGDTILGTNMFAYCENKPVNMADSLGCYASSIVLSSAYLTSLGGATSGIIASISASMAGVKSAIATSWVPAVCIACAAVAIVGIVYTVNRVKALNAASRKVIAAVKSKINAGGINPKQLSGYSVYVIAPKRSTDICYVGMTRNFKARQYYHQIRKNAKYPIKKYDMYPIATGLTKNKARVLEQTIITAYGLDTLKNLINSISPKKWSRFKSEYRQMRGLINSFFDPE